MLGQNFATSVVSYLSFVSLECSIVTFHTHGIVQEYLVIPFLALLFRCYNIITIDPLYTEAICFVLILYSNLRCNLFISTTMLPDERCAKASSMHVYIFSSFTLQFHHSYFFVHHHFTFQ